MSDVPPVGTTLGRLRLLETYFAYDGPKLFACENTAGQVFLGLFVADQAGGELYLYVPVSNQRWLSVRRGAVSLKSAFEAPEDGFAFLVSRSFDGNDSGVATIPSSQINPVWLPEAGTVLRVPERQPNAFSPDDLAVDAIRRVRPAAALELITDEPPDDFPLRSLGTLMQLLQENVDAFAQEAAGRPTPAGPIPQPIAEDAELAFTALRAASVVLVVSPRSAGRLLAPPVVTQALIRMRDLMEATNGPEGPGEAIASLGPRAVSKYRDLLEEVADTSSAMIFHVATEFGEIGSARLDGAALRSALEAVRNTQEPAQELQVDGILVGTNSRTYVFELFDEIQNRKISGKIAKEARAQVLGLTIGQRYRATILQEQEIAPLTGEVKFKYRLVRIGRV